MAEKDVPKVRQERSLFDALANRRECPHLGRCVRHGRTDSRPSWLTHIDTPVYLRTPAIPAGHPPCGNCHEEPAAVGYWRPGMCAGSLEASGRLRQNRQHNTHFAGVLRERLEPATSGVTGQFEGREVDDAWHRVALFMRV